MGLALERFAERLLPSLLLPLARLFRERGHASLALACLRQAARVAPSNAEPWYLSGRQLLLDGDFERAADAFREAVRIRPGHAEALNNLGIALYETGRPDEAAACYRRALEARPGQPAAWNNLGNVRLAQGALDEAQAALGEALRLSPDYAEAHNNLGLLLRARGQAAEAERAFRRALEIRPAFAGALSNLGGALQAQGRMEDAIEAYDEALRLEPGLGEAHANLAILLGDTERIGAARAYYEREARRRPESPEARNSVAAALIAQGLWDEAQEQLGRLLESRPGFTDALVNLAGTYVFQGRVEDALRTFREVLAAAPNAGIHSSYAFYRNYCPEIPPEDVAAEYRRWGERHAPASAAGPARRPAAAQRRKLRVGYLSPDFRQHSVAYFIEPILRAHDRERFEVFCYANVIRPDRATEALRGIGHAWRDIHRKSDRQVEKLIQDDGIDILVDLAGHTSRSRLAVFARKPAPVQATYLGHPATTGMAAMDYRITDAVADPPGMTEALHTERLVRLPGCFLAYAPPRESPPVAPPPCLRKGHVTFGSFNNAAKINPALAALWARILDDVPGSRLFVKSFVFSSAGAREHFRTMFAQAGIGPERLQLAEFVPGVSSHLELYGEVDVALDTHPYHGTTTTCEALWMGVPVVCLVGRSHLSRVGMSLLATAGLERFAAADAQAYRRIAVALARDPGELQALRGSLRQAVASSPLVDAGRLTRQLEDAYRDMWARVADAPLAPGPAAAADPTADRKLHIGGTVRSPGWEVLNAVPGPHVDHLADARDLSRFADGTFGAIYASHVLEHLDYARDLPAALGEWHRVLRPGGTLYVSVPDLDALAALFLDPALTPQERFFVMRMIFGGHADAHDYHQAGLNEAFLADFLAGAGFAEARRVAELGLFDDTSAMRFKGRPISLNMVAVKAGA